MSPRHPRLRSSFAAGIDEVDRRPMLRACPRGNRIKASPKVFRMLSLSLTNAKESHLLMGLGAGVCSVNIDVQA
jgi:hypothetical protein